MHTLSAGSSSSFLRLFVPAPIELGPFFVAYSNRGVRRRVIGFLRRLGLLPVRRPF